MSASQDSSIKRTIGELSSDVDREYKRASGARLSGGQLTIAQGIASSSSSALSAAIAHFVIAEGLPYTIVDSRYDKGPS